MLGEVHTGLLQHSSALTPDRSAHALALLLGEPVRRSERPIAYAVSPDTLTGVDCAIATGSGARTRAVGTVAARACLVGGHVLQGSAYVQVVRGEANRRLPWSHYLSRLGTVETIGRADPDDLVRGFVVPQPPVGTLDLGTMSGRVMDAAQIRANPDRKPPFKMWRSRLRWAAIPTGPEGAEPEVRFRIEEGNVRTVTVQARTSTPAAIVELCEDLALHDWLLTTLLRVLDRSRIGALPRGEVLHRLSPAADHLLHLWMPAARLDPSLLAVWDSIERRPGFTRQWLANVNRVRDVVAVTTALHSTLTDLRRQSV